MMIKAKKRASRKKTKEDVKAGTKMTPIDDTDDAARDYTAFQRVRSSEVTLRVPTHAAREKNLHRAHRVLRRGLVALQYSPVLGSKCQELRVSELVASVTYSAPRALGSRQL